MDVNEYPSYVDETFRVEFVECAKERVFWVSSKFTSKEMEAVDRIKNKLTEDCVVIFKSQKSTISETGYCFSLEDGNGRIDVQLRSRKNGINFDSLLVVDNIACIYDCENAGETYNAKFIDDIEDVSLSELIKSNRK
ncbi:MAG: hypothetical protein Q8930_02455 [Bacillota bacterium]|nr:hypothetical protein [Bacillota bacterium]